MSCLPPSLVAGELHANEPRNSELLQSLASGNVELLRHSLSSGADVNLKCPDPVWSTPLHIAAAQASPACLVELLQGSNKPVCERNAMGESPLFIACRASRSITTPLLLLSAYGVPTHTNNNGDTFLHVLLQNELMAPSQLLELIQWILNASEAVAILNIENGNAKTVYDIAREHRTDDHMLLHQLLQHGAVSAHIQHSGRQYNVVNSEVAQRAALEQHEAVERGYLSSRLTNSLVLLRDEEEATSRFIAAEEQKRLSIISKEDQHRCHITRKLIRQLKSSRKAARKLEDQRRNASASTLQAVGRGYVSRLTLSRVRQRGLLRTEAQQPTLQARLTASAVTLERVGRGALDRKKLRDRVRHAHTATAVARVCAAQTMPTSSTNSIRSETVPTTPERRRTQVYQSDEKEQTPVKLTASEANLGHSGHRQMDVFSVCSPPSSTLVTVQFADPSPADDSGAMRRAAEHQQLGGQTKDSTAKCLPKAEREMGMLHLSALQSASSEGTPELWPLEPPASMLYSETDAACRIQRWWRRCTFRLRTAAVSTIERALSASAVRAQLFTYCLERGIKKRIQTITGLVTSLVWRENFCSEFRRITREKRFARRALTVSRAPEPLAAAHPWHRRWRAITEAYQTWTLLAQMTVSLFLLIYMGCAPRAGEHNVHNKVDIAFCTVQLVLLLGFPLSLWRLVDGAVIITALVCAACKAYGGTIVITLLLLKAPLLVSYLAPNHSATNTYCRALRYGGLYLLMLSPLGLACVGSTVRGTSRSSLLLTSQGNWARVLLVLWSTLSPQYAVRTLSPAPAHPHASADVITPQGPPFYGSRTVVKTTTVNDEWVLQTAKLPTVQLLICNVGLLVFFYCAIIVGTNNAIREHYDLSDETKLKRNKRRFQYKYYKQKMELLDAHRAATIEALGQQLDGLMWEDDIRAAKEAIRESHKVQFQSTADAPLGATTADAAPTHATDGPHFAKSNAAVVSPHQSASWDCRNEDPQCRGRLDIAAIETALGKAERTDRRERFFMRQWKGSVFRRESTLVVLAFVILSSVEPNVYAMEAVFSAVLTVELLLSLYCLRMEFILSHPWRLLIRLFCAVIGFVPSGTPFVVLRGLRLLEGWSTLFDIPGMVKWGIMYCLITMCTIWMVSFVASLQFAAAAQARGHVTSSYCTGTSNCLALSLRELVLPAWTPLRVDPVHEPPVTCLLIVAFQFLFIPFVLSFMLHPLLQLSSFIGRFLRLVVRSLHKDVLGFLGNYIEGEEWFRRWSLVVAIPTSVIVKLKLWVHDIQRSPVGLGSLTSTRAARLAHDRSFFFRNDTMVMPLSSDESRDGREEEVPYEPTEIISKSRFASFVDTATYQRHFQQRTKGDTVPLQKQPQQQQHLTGAPRTVWVKPPHVWRLRLDSLSRQTWLHVVNLVLTATSFAFLWAADASSHPRDAVVVLATVFHMASIVTNFLVVPRDLTAILTVISSTALIASTVIIHLGEAGLQPIYAVRFLSLLRLAQIQVYPFRSARQFLHEYLDSWMKVLFPFFVVGGLSYAAELLRAQIYLVRHPTFAPSNATNTSTAVSNTVWGLADTPNWRSETGGVNSSYPEWVASIPRTHHDRPNTNATRSLFSFFFTEDAYIFFSIFNFWLLPALAISTCLSYLYWSGSNLRDTDRSVIFLIPFLEDPLTLASFRFSQSFLHYVANAVLVLSVTFGCIFSPTTTTVAGRDHNFFFAFEAGFTCVGLIDALLSMAFAVYRSRRTWAGRSISRQDFRYVHVLVGDTALVLAEVVQLLYYSVAFPLTIAMLVDADNLLLSPDDYALYFITLRFALLLRLLPRQCLLTFIQAFPTVIFACAGIVIYYVASASALADTAGASSGGLTPALWREAFTDLIRESLTLAVPRAFTSEWTITNETAIALDMLASSTYTRVTGTGHSAAIMVFILSTIGKAIVSSALGLGAAILLVPLRTPLVAPLPPKSAQLYRALSGGINAIVKEGEALHDDMRPEARRRLQRRKFTRMFTARGIPSWSLRHLLEELNIARPSRQRRFMFLLEQLLIFLPISDLRQEQVREYMNMWSCYCSGGPATLSFTELAVYPPRDTSLSGAARATSSSSHPANPLDERDTTARRGTPRENAAAEARYIAPLRLIQALALFELNFPADSSIGSQLLMDFFTVVQKVRAASLMQSLWRMYRCEKCFEADASRTKVEKVKLTYLRRQFRKLRMKNDASFRRSASVSGNARTDSFAMALANDTEVYNLDTGHFDLLNRLRGHYHHLTLSPGTPANEEVDSDY